MIYCLSGELIVSDAVNYTVVIDCAGVGYKVTVTSNTLSHLPVASTKPSKVRLYTYMQIREDALDLFGFYTTQELDMFKLLISVSGVGPKAAMSILSLLTPEKLADAVAREDAKAISKAPNVGAKTAARVILELKDKLAKEFPTVSADHVADSAGHTGTASGENRNLSDAQDALLVLGYSRQEITAALKKVDQSASLETMIRAALAVLMKQ